MNRKSLKLLFVFLFSIAIIAGLIFYLLMNKPFGIFFNTSFFILSGSLICGFVIIGFICFKSSKRWLRFVGILPALFGLMLFILTLVICIDIRMLYFLGLPPNPTKEEWVKDLHFLATQMQEKYPNLYSEVSEEKFTKTVKDIETRIPKLSESEIVLELFRLTALPNNAHTLPFVVLPCYDLHDLPLKIFKFEDGWYIIDAAREYNNLIGSKILKIGSTDIDTLYNKFPTFLAAENESMRKERFTYIGLVPEWLKSQGAVDLLDQIPLTLEKQNGEQIVETIDAVNFIYKIYWSFMISIDNHSYFLLQNLRHDKYWFKMMDDNKTIYFQFNMVSNQKGKETISEFSKRLNDFVNTHDFDRFIIDIRNNVGGDPPFLNDLVNVIRDNNKINQRNKLFVLTGRRTFSAGVMFANKLKLQTKAIFIGEPASQGPVFVANPKIVTLPNSKLIFAISTQSSTSCQTSWDFPTENAIIPDVTVQYTHNDFLNKKDPAIETALKYKSTEQFSLTLTDAILTQYTGRFLLSPFQVVDIKLNGSKLSICIDDFIPGNLFRVQSELYAKSENEFKTDISNVIISFPKNSVGKISSLQINWNGQIKIAKRTPDNFKLAMELFAENQIDAGLTMMMKNKQEYSKLSMFDDALNLVGYELLNQNKADDAIKVFCLAVELFPESWNAYDSLGEAYLKAGKNELAIENYKKSVKLNPNNKSGIKALKNLEK